MRLEKDAIDWARMLGGVDKYLQVGGRCVCAARRSPAGRSSQPLLIPRALLPSQLAPPPCV
jgi:hypothetical protein